MGVTLCRSNSLRRWPESGGAPVQKATVPGPGPQADFIPRATGWRAPAFLGGRCLHSPEPWYPPPPLLRLTWRQAVSHSTGGAQRPDAFAAQGVRWTHLCGQCWLLLSFHCDETCWLRLSETPLAFPRRPGCLFCAWDLCLGPLNSAVLPGKWLTSALPSLCWVWRAQLWTSWNSRKNPLFSLSSFLHLPEQHLFGFMNVRDFFFSFLIAHQIFSSKNAVLINLMNLPCVFWTQVSMRVMVTAFWKNLLKNMSPYNKFLQRVHFHIKILSAAVFFYTLQPLAVVLQSPEATVLKTWAWLLFGLFSFWPP